MGILTPVSLDGVLLRDLYPLLVRVSIARPMANCKDLVYGMGVTWWCKTQEACSASPYKPIQVGNQRDIGQKRM